MKLLATIILLGLIATITTSAQELIPTVRALLKDGRRSEAEKAIRAARAKSVPEALAGQSWIGRDLLARKQYTQALDVANAVREEAEKIGPASLIDRDPFLPTAIGAAIEVQAQSLHGLKQTSEAVTLLQQALKTYQGSTITVRLYKNLNLISLVGSRALPIPVRQNIGAPGGPLSQYRGKPVVLFFWAHWCPDCKDEMPILAELQKKHKGIVVLGPTQLYGYANAGEDATPAEETKHIAKVYREFVEPYLKMPVYIDATTFRRYGSSTTPTVVIVDRAGIVRTYHPGKMSLAELEQAVGKL